MIRPIRVAPLSNVQMSQQPLVPNTMTNADYLANQFASGNFAQPTAMAVSRPLPQSPVQAPTPTTATQQLAQVGQQGVQGAQDRVSKRITQSPRVQGLLGGDQGAGGLLSDINAQAGLEGLFATMQAIGRPVARGEDRFLGAVEYGRGVQQQAREQGIQNLSTQMRLEEMQSQRDREQRREQMMQEVLLGGTGQADQPAEPMDITASGMFNPFEVDQMTEGQRTAAQEAVSFQTLADRFTQADMPEEAKQYADMAQQRAEDARRGLLTNEKRIELENRQRTEFSEKEYRPRADAVSAYNRIAALSERGAGLSDYANLIAFIKTLDPTSVVREGEVALAGEFQTLSNRLETIYNKAAQGGFTEEFRRDLVETARRAAEIASQSYENAVEAQLPVIERQNLRPEQVIVRPSLDLAPLPSFIADNSDEDGDIGSRVKSVRKSRGVAQ